MPTYQGHCHCEAVAFEVTTEAEINSGVRCNCSLCSRKGAVMALVDQGQFKLTKGESDLTEYQWNTKVARHFFCKHCGIYTHHQPRTAADKIGFNVACIDELSPLDFPQVDLRNGAGLSVES